MRFAFLILLWILLVVACGNEETGGAFGLCSEATIEERDAVWQVYDAFLELGYELHCCVVFVRSPNQEIVEGATWDELPTKHKIEARNAAEGWRGWYHDGVSYVRRYGEAEPYLESLLIHELAHSVGFHHGPEMQRFEAKVLELTQK